MIVAEAFMVQVKRQTPKEKHEWKK
jgi:hypothetical protein